MQTLCIPRMRNLRPVYRERMRRFRQRSQFAVLAAAVFSLTGVLEAATIGLEELVRDVELIVAVKILSTDDRAMPADGPMYVDARVVKVVKPGFPF